MNHEIIIQKVIDMFSMMADTVDEVTVESELIEDLGISSMDVLILICNLEEEFSIKVPEKEIRKMVTISDVVDTVARLSD